MSSEKRAIRERAELIKFGGENLARELLQVIDNVERALDHMPADTDKSLVEGLHMTMNQFRAVLQKQGVEPIRTQNQSFNPEFHEAVGQETSEHPEGTVIKEHLKGYTMHGRLLRPARVVVSGGNSNPDSQS